MNATTKEKLDMTDRRKMGGSTTIGGISGGPTSHMDKPNEKNEFNLDEEKRNSQSQARQSEGSGLKEGFQGTKEATGVGVDTSGQGK